MIFFDRNARRPYDCALMLNEPLPSQIDIRKLATKGVEIAANFPVSRLKRFQEMLADEQGSVDAKLVFYIDEQGLRRVGGEVHSNVQVVCQRCLQPVPIRVDCSLNLAIVWTDEDAQNLPKAIEPLIVGEELTDLADIVEEELILSLPFVNYHDLQACPAGETVGYTSAEQPVAEEPKENPFKVLEQLKSNK